MEPIEHWGGLKTRWDRRAKIAAEWLQSEAVVADIGCGLMTLEPYLPKDTKYIPMDLVARDNRTLVFDLTKDSIPAVKCSVAVMIGVLEYLDDVRPVLEGLKKFPKCVVSYNHVSINDLLWTLGLRSKSVDWRNRHRRHHFRRLLNTCGLKILRERRIRLGEALYEVVPSTSAIAKTRDLEPIRGSCALPKLENLAVARSEAPYTNRDRQ